MSTHIIIDTYNVFIKTIRFKRPKVIAIKYNIELNFYNLSLHFIQPIFVC